MDKKEEWKPVVGYEGLYEVSNIGKIKSLKKTVNHKLYGTKNKNEFILNINKTTNFGYYKCKLTKDGITRCYFVHRIVANAFIENKNNYPIINHIDGIKTNNSVDNLEWCTYRHNANHFNSNQKRSSKYAGVSYNKNSRKWIANIRIGKNQKYLGLFNEEEDAYNAYILELNKINN
jgi:hypothetical protein